MSATVTNGTRAEKTPASADFTYTVAGPSAKGAGWVLFAGIMLAVAATLNVIWGIAAISSSSFFVAGAHYIVSSLNTWGWIAVGWGALQFLAALSIWRGGQFGRWFGIAAASLAIILAMLTIPAYPFWGLTLVAIDILVIYGLVAYGGNPELMR